MKRGLFISFVCAAAVALSATSGLVPSGEAFLHNQQKRDSVLIGDRVGYGVLLKDVPDGSGLAFPDFRQGFCEGVEVLSQWQLDTVKTSKAGKGIMLMDIEATTVLTSFDEGEYDLPAIRVLRQTSSGQLDTLLFDGKILSVKTMPVDTATFVPHDIRGQMRYPLTFKEVFPWILGAVVLAVLVWLMVGYIRSKKGVAGIKAAPDEPAHITALCRLDALRGDKFWSPEKQKYFYSSVTDTLREYMAARWGFGAMEMTIDEIFASLKDKGLPKDLYDSSRLLFETSDFVKYAKHTVGNDDNAKAVPLAVRFVTDTYEREIDADGKAEEGQKDVL